MDTKDTHWERFRFVEGVERKAIHITSKGKVLLNLQHLEGGDSM